MAAGGENASRLPSGPPPKKFFNSLFLLVISDDEYWIAFEPGGYSPDGRQETGVIPPIEVAWQGSRAWTNLFEPRE
jgi:hypothetical protein